MIQFCPRCKEKNTYEKGACSICGLDQIPEIFLSAEDVQRWYESVVDLCGKWTPHKAETDGESPSYRPSEEKTKEKRIFLKLIILAFIMAVVAENLLINLMSFLPPVSVEWYGMILGLGFFTFITVLSITVTPMLISFVAACISDVLSKKRAGKIDVFFIIAFVITPTIFVLAFGTAAFIYSGWIVSTIANILWGEDMISIGRLMGFTIAGFLIILIFTYHEK